MLAAGPGDGASAARPLTTAASAAMTTTDEAAPAAPADGEQDEAANPVVEFFKQTEVSGFVDVYYLWAFNEESPQLRNFDIQHNAFTLNYARRFKAIDSATVAASSLTGAALATVERVVGEELVAEITRMLGADRGDEVASRHARELLAA